MRHLVLVLLSSFCAVVAWSEAFADGDIANVGQIKVLQGTVTLTHVDGQKLVLAQSASAELQEKDQIESAASSSALISFRGGNRVHMHPLTALAIQEFRSPDESAYRRMVLQLLRGKIRNQVEQKYNGQTSYYRVQTKEAVASVRGTDFVAEQIEAMPGTSSPQMRVETFKGIVNLSSLGETQSVDVHAGEGVKFSNGVLGSLYQLTDEQIHNLEISSRVDVIRAPSSVVVIPDRAICAAPAGKFNQCVWRCVGNPKGESRCRTDQVGVRCLRERCDGNGQWADPTPLSAVGACPKPGDFVKNCDY